MSKLGIYTEIDTTTFLRSATGLELQDLENLVQKLNVIIAQKKTVSLEKQEAKLLHLHNTTVLPTNQQILLQKLTQKLENQTISDEERKTLLDLTTEEETLRNQRLKYLIELAQLKQTPLPVLMDNLGLKPYGYE